MHFTLRLVEVLEPQNRKLIVKRLVSDLSIDFKKAEYLLDRLPLELRHDVNEEEVQNAILDYEKLGCRVTKLRENKGAEKPPVHPEPQKTEIPNIRAPLGPAPAGRPLRFTLQSPKEIWLRRPRRKTLVQITGLITFVLLLALAFYAIKRKPPSLPTAPGAPFSGPAGTPAPDAQAQAMDPETEELVAQADSVASENEKLEMLQKAAKRAPKNEIVQQKMSSAYEAKAKAEFSDEGRIRFYQMAVQFNPYNEGAWDGLIQAYEGSGMQDKARETAREKAARFQEAHIKLNKFFNSFGTLEGIPRITGGELFLAYRSGQADEAGLQTEMKRMAVKIRGIRNFRRIVITAITEKDRIVGEF
jgi:hypothetical protein